MKIELKNIKHSEFASHETYCFMATIYIDGKKAGMAENDGRGGCTNFHPYELEVKINEYAKTLPPRESNYPDPKDASKKWVYEEDAESLINNLITDHLYSKDLKRRLAKRVLTLKEGAIYETSALNKLQMNNYIEKLKQTNETWRETILNLMPFDKALTIYREGVNHA